MITILLIVILIAILYKYKPFSGLRIMSAADKQEIKTSKGMMFLSAIAAFFIGTSIGDIEITQDLIDSGVNLIAAVVAEVILFMAAYNSSRKNG